MEKGKSLKGSEENLLIITYVFPPVGGIMVQRVLNFAKYLPQNGVGVHVLTAWNPATPVYDPDLVKQIPKEVKVHHAFTPEPPFYLRKKIWARFAGKSEGKATGPAHSAAAPTLTSKLADRVRKVLSPDAQVLWTPFATQRAAQIIRKYDIRNVLVTAPPFSLFMVGTALKRRFPHIRLISDFRDEWLRFMLTDFDFMKSDYTRQKAEGIERDTVENSDLVVAVTDSSRNEIRSRYPEQPDSKFALIPNGYDPELFKEFQPRAPERQKVLITHVGTAYKTSSPAYYLHALANLPPEYRDRIETHFIGRVAETETTLLESFKGQVRVDGFMPQSQALRYMEETDYLLLTMTNDFSLPGKLFEYLATGKPVLAISPLGGEVDRILKETGAGWCVDPDDAAGIQNMLTRACDAARNIRDVFRINWDAIHSYQRPRLAAQLAGQIRALAGFSAAERR